MADLSRWASEAPPVTSDAAPADVVSLYRAHYWPMVRLATVLVDDLETAEDLVQEAYLSLHRKNRMLRQPDRAVDYLRSSVLNLARSHVRRRIASRRRQRELERLELVREQRLPSAEQSAMLSNRQRELDQAVRRLPRRQREVVVLRYSLELSDAEIARALDITTGSVKQHLFRAIRALRCALEEGS